MIKILSYYTMYNVLYMDIICFEDQNEAQKISKNGPGIANGSPKV